ncbi:MAG: type II toxin-antitoxin system RelE/ParE family toxin [Methylovulum sp.]
MSYPWLGSERVTRTAGAAAGMSGRVMFAAGWAGMLIKAFAKIATPRELKAGLRSQTVGNYLIFYFPLEDGVDIVRVLHGSRDIENLL